jgi:hypothetical protein
VTADSDCDSLCRVAVDHMPGILPACEAGKAKIPAAGMTQDAVIA